MLPEGQYLSWDDRLKRDSIRIRLDKLEADGSVLLSTAELDQFLKDLTEMRLYMKPALR